MDAFCPNCGSKLKNRPARKTKCPHCGRFIYVRQGRLVGDGQATVARHSTTKTKGKANPLTILVGILTVLSLCCGIILIGGKQNTSAPRSAAGPTATDLPTLELLVTTYPKTTPVTKLKPTNTPNNPTDTPIAAIDKKPTSTPTLLSPATPFVKAEKDVNLRNGPGTNYEVIGALSPGQSFKIVGRNTDSSWWQIAVDNEPVWVAASVVKAANLDQEIEVVEAPPPPTPTAAPTSTVIIPTSTPILLPTFTPAPFSPAPPPSPGGGGCCRVCTTGKACGDSCISANKTCHKGPGCACNG